MQCRFEKTDRTGLYIMVFFAMLYSCNADTHSQRMYDAMCAAPNPAVELHCLPPKEVQP